MSAEPAAREPSKPIAGPVPLALAQAEAPAPQLRQQLTEMAEAVAALPDAKVSEPASAPPAMCCGCWATRIPLIPIQRRTFRPLYPR